jgi:hypothetical protein
MLDLWGLVNRCSLMIVVVGRYSIPLEIFSGIVYVALTDSRMYGITWKICTREWWDPDQAYDVVAKGWHTWHVRRRAYVVLVSFIPLQGLLLIRISTTLLDMSDSLFTAPIRRYACFM